MNRIPCRRSERVGAPAPARRPPAKAPCSTLLPKFLHRIALATSDEVSFKRAELPALEGLPTLNLGPEAHLRPRVSACSRNGRGRGATIKISLHRDFVGT